MNCISVGNDEEILRKAFEAIPPCPSCKSSYCADWLLKYLKRIREDVFGPFGLIRVLGVLIDREGGELIMSQGRLNQPIVFSSVELQNEKLGERFVVMRSERTSEPEAGEFPIATGTLLQDDDPVM